MSRRDISGDSSAGARASNAGDRYHFEWFAQRMLRLLHPRSDLRLIVMEGVASGFPGSGSGSEDYQAVDMSEYYGADTPEQASKIVLTQLKYSFAYPDRPWTIGRLCSEKKVKGVHQQGTSVLGKLARAWQAVKTRVPTADVEMVIRSNQPLGKRDGPTLAKCMSLSRAAADGISSSAFDGAGPRVKSAMAKLLEATALDEEDLARLLADLSLVGFGSPLLEAAHGQLVQEMEHWDSRSLVGNVRQLCAFAGECANAGRQNEVRRENVLAELGLSDTDFSPAPYAPAPIIHAIVTGAISRLVAEIRSCESGFIVLHGPPGCGKSVTVQQLAERCGSGSHVVAYDFWQDGRGANVGEEVWSAPVCVTQLVNDLDAVWQTNVQAQTGLPIRHLTGRLDLALAAATRSAQALGEKVVVVLDAADNALMGYEKARKHGAAAQPALPLLWERRLPPGVVFVVTSRTENVDQLGLPAHIGLELDGFAQGETTAYLRAHWPSANDEACELAHERTKGNPRTQSILFPLAAQDEVPARYIEEHAKQQLFDIYHDILDDVVSKNSEPQLDACLSVLAVAATPIPIADLAAASKVAVNWLTPLLGKLSFGLSVDAAAGIHFRDQDFHDFVHERTEDRRDGAAQALAEYSWDAQSSSSYAREHLARHLYQAKQYDRLLEWLPGNASERTASMPVGRAKLLEDLRLGLIACAKTGRFADAVKLLVASADVQQVSRVFSSALAGYGRAVVNAKYHYDWLRDLEATEAQGELASACFEIASELSDAGQCDEPTARSLLETGWHALPRSNNGTVELKLEQCGWIMGARLPIDGAQGVLAWIDNLKGEGTHDGLFVDLGRHIAVQQPGRAWDLCQELSDEPRKRACILTGVVLAGTSVPQDHLRQASQALADHVRATGEELPETLTLLERLLPLGAPRGTVRTTADPCGAQWPRFPTDYREAYEERFMPWARRDGLSIALGLPRLSVPSGNGREDPKSAAKSSEEERREREVKERLDLQTQAQTVLWRALAQEPAAQVCDEVCRCVAAWKARMDRPAWDKFEPSGLGMEFGFAATAMLRALALLPGRHDALVDEIVGAAPRLGSHGFLHSTPEMVAALSCSKHRSPQAEALVEQERERLRTPGISGEDAVSGLLKLSDACLLLDPALSADVLDDARKAASLMTGHLRSETKLLAAAARAGAEASRDRPETARRLASALRRLHDTSWEPSDEAMREGVEALALVDPLVALETAVQWETVPGPTFEHVAGPGVVVLANNTRIPAEIAWPLAYLSDSSDDSVATCVASLERMVASGAGHPAVAQAVRQAAWFASTQGSLHERPMRCRAFADSMGRLGLDDLLPVREIRDWASSVDHLARPARRRDFISDWESDEQIVRELRDQLSLDPLLCLSQTTEAIDSGALSWWTAMTVLRDIAEAIPAVALPDLVEALVGAEHGSRAQPRMRILAHALLARGTTLPAVRIEEIAKGIIEILGESSAEVLSWECQQGGDAMRATVQALSSEWDRWAGPLLEAMTAQLGEAESEAIFMAAAWFTERLEPEDAGGVLEGLLSRWIGAATPEPIVADAFRDDLSHAVIRLLCYLLGHPAQRLRWRATHALVDMCLADPGVALPVLFDAADDRTHPRWMSVREWVLFIARSVAEADALVLHPLVPRLLQYMDDQEFPHVQIREHAKRALLSIALAAPDALDDDALAAVQAVNEPMACLLTDGPAQIDEYGGRYHFDAMDTLRYVFSPMARCFGLHESDVCRAAEKWLEQWGVNGDLRPDEPWNYARYDWQARSARQGVEPSVQDARNYFERHVVRLVAGEWLRTKPAVCGEAPGVYDWGYWLEGHATEADPALTSRLITPTPAVPDCWRSDAPPVAEWLEVPSYNEVIGEVRDSMGAYQWVVVAGWRSVRMPERGVHLGVRSVLVPSETAQAYARMLASYEAGEFCPPQLKMPYLSTLGDTDVPENAEWDAYGVEDVPEHLPYAVCAPTSYVYQELHYHPLDPYWPTGRSFYVAGPGILAPPALARDSGALRWRGPTGEVLAKGEVWDDDRPGARGGSQGLRFLVRLDPLIEILATTNQVLVSHLLVTKWAGPDNGVELERREHACVVALYPNGTDDHWMTTSSEPARRS